MKFKKGNSGNPRGRPKGAKGKTQRHLLLEAIARVEKKKGKKLFTHAAEECYKDSKLLAAILKKLVPDQRTLEVSGGLDLVHQLSDNIWSKLDDAYKKHKP